MKRWIIIALTIMISVGFIACKNAETDLSDTGTTIETEIQTDSIYNLGIDTSLIEMSAEDYPKVNGSTATLPLSAALYRLATGASEAEADGAIIHSKTTFAYWELVHGNVDLILAYEPSKETYDLIKTENAELEFKPIGLDALVFIENETNQVTSLTKEQLVGIYSGKIQNWSELGGSDKEIKAFQRPSSSGSQTLMEKLVMGDTPMEEGLTVATATTMGEIITQVASYNNDANALGYSVFFYANNMDQQPSLRFLDIDGVAPSNETIKSGAYPFVNEFYAVIRKDTPKDSKAYQLYQWLTDAEGQKLVEKLGYVGIGEK